MQTNPTPPWGVNQPYGTPDSVPPVLPYDCGVEANMTGGCLFNVRALLLPVQGRLFHIDSCIVIR